MLYKRKLLYRLTVCCLSHFYIRDKLRRNTGGLNDSRYGCIHFGRLWQALFVCLSVGFVFPTTSSICVVLDFNLLRILSRESWDNCNIPRQRSASVPSSMGKPVEWAQVRSTLSPLLTVKITLPSSQASAAGSQPHRGTPAWKSN